MQLSKKTITFITFFSIFTAFMGTSVHAQSDSSATRIEISTEVEKTKVPLNRSMKLFVTLSWTGDQDRYSVVDFDNPALTNFDIVGTATVNRSEVIANRTHVFKEYVYTLRPRELGMSYVEGVIVKYRDTVLDREENLVTQRIAIEVVDPLPDPKEARPLWQYGILVLGFFLMVGLILVWRRRRTRAEEEVELTPAPPLEESYLELLRNEVNLEHPDLREDFAALSRLLRRYLTERFQIRALEGATDELVSDLTETELEEHQAASTKEILTRCDEIKFSGMEGKLEELNRYYTLLEGILQFFLRKREVDESAEQKEKYK